MMGMQHVDHLIIARNDAGAPVAFTGIQDQKLEMLFLDPDERGKGLGRELFQHGVKHFGIQELTVNEQNQQVLGFCEYMGFCVYQRMDHDEQGKPYPILKMQLSLHTLFTTRGRRHNGVCPVSFSL